MFATKICLINPLEHVQTHARPQKIEQYQISPFIDRSTDRTLYDLIFERHVGSTVVHQWYKWSVTFRQVGNRQGRILPGWDDTGTERGYPGPVQDHVQHVYQYVI